MPDRLFHGTDAILAVGELIEPRMKAKGFATGGAYATAELVTACAFGSAVYEVEALPGDAPLRRPMSNCNDEGHIELVSAVGFRIVGVVDEDTIAEEFAANGYRTCDDCDQVSTGGEDWEHGLCPDCEEAEYGTPVAA